MIGEPSPHRVVSDSNKAPIMLSIQSTAGNDYESYRVCTNPHSRFIRLDHIFVEFGAMWRGRLTEWDEILPGDIYRFPSSDIHAGKSWFYSSDEVVGQLVLMDDYAKTLKGRVFAQSNDWGESCFWVELPEDAKPVVEYVLIDKDTGAPC